METEEYVETGKNADTVETVQENQYRIGKNADTVETVQENQYRIWNSGPSSKKHNKGKN